MPVRTFSTEGRDADWQAVEIDAQPGFSTFVVVTPDGDRVPARVPLTGAYNVSNALCAIAGLAEAGGPTAPPPALVQLFSRASLRTLGDQIEVLTAHENWPLPTYREMLFVK